MSSYHSMIKKINEIIENVSILDLEELELLYDDLRKSLKYIELDIQAKKIKKDFQSTLNNQLDQHIESIQSENLSSEVCATTDITDNDIRCGILRVGKKSEVAKSLQSNSQILIEYKGNEYQGSVPKIGEGRINGLTDLYREHQQEILVQRKFTVKYNLEKKHMLIE